MKLTKLSLVAALLIGSSAFAVENVAVSGDANVFYHTQDAATTPDVLAGRTDGTLFSKDSSAADASLNLAISADLVGNDLVKVSGKAGYTVISTLGLENNFVSNVWGSSHTATTGTGACYAGTPCHPVSEVAVPGGIKGAKVENANFFTEAYVTVAAQAATKTSLMLGRMELDTPLAFTETWSVEKNTFEAAVVMNQDIPDTTVVAAYVGNGNGNETMGQDLTSPVVAGFGLAMGGTVNADGEFGTFGTDGAYAVGAVNNSYEPLTVQAWYYDVTRVATATWLQADLACQMVPGLMAGLQYSTLDPDAAGADTGSIMAGMLGYEMKDVATVKVAYSQTAEDAGAGANVATSTGASKIYTEAWWMYGAVTAADTTSYNLTAESPVNGLFDLGVYYTKAMVDPGSDTRDLTVTAGKEFGPLAATLAYINYKVGDADAVNNVQAYLTLSY